MFCTTLQDPLWYFLYFGPGTDQVSVWIQFGLRATDSMSTPTLNKEKVRLNKIFNEKCSLPKFDNDILKYFCTYFCCNIKIEIYIPTEYL